MKKVLLAVLSIIALIIIIVVMNVNAKQIQLSETIAYNKQFEEYKGKTLYGADVLTIINKAIDNNNEYNIQKDSDGYYIDDNNKTMKVEIILITKDKDEKIVEVRRPMEVLQKVGLDGFISSFSLTAFECSDIQYNKSGRISKILLKQLEI